MGGLHFPISIAKTGAMLRLVAYDTQRRHQESPNLTFGPNTEGLFYGAWITRTLYQFATRVQV